MAEALEKQYTAKRLSERQEELLQLARGVLASSPADQTFVRAVSSDSALTRFANSEIHQNTFEREATVVITARVGQREGSVSTNRLAPEALAEAAERATAAARVSEPNPDLADFLEGPREYPFQVDYYEATAATTPESRARLVTEGIQANDDPTYTAAGTLSTQQVNVAIVNSNGIEAAYNTTDARYTVLWTGPDSSGYAEWAGRNIGELEPESHSVTALATAKRSANPRNDVPAGRYTVVLGPECITTMLNFLSWLGFSGKDYLDGSSFVCGKLDEPVTGRHVTLSDDPLNPRTLGVPCDAAGTPRQRLVLIEGGVARAVVHDANTAKRAGTASTGHDTGGNYPLPVNLVLDPGTATREDLIAGIDHGVYVSRFHYTNVVDPLATVITGMTRDGTFLIERGELGSGLTNFRFTQNVLQALADSTGMSANQVYHGSFWGGGSLVPDAICVEEFNFSGKTGF
jgi:predicted Zn-dependent protease